MLCQRCARTICGDCQIPAAVGVHCPECHQAAKKSAPRVRAARSARPRATIFLLATMVVAFAGQLLTGGFVTELMVYWPPLGLGSSWRMVTSLFVHSETNFLHLLFNGYSLYVLGSLLERLLGSTRFMALFFLGGMGGSLAVLWLAFGSAVIGASGAIFALFGALLVIQRSFGVTNPQLVIVLVINLVMGFVVPGISWQAHIGGLVTGLVIGWGLVKTRETAKTLGSMAVFTAVLAAIAVATVARYTIG